MPDRAGKGRSADGENPSSYPETTPFVGAAQSDWVLQALHELQRSFGRNEKAVENLEQAARDHSADLKEIGKTIGSIKKTIYIATGVVIAVAAIFGYVIEHDYAKLAKLIQPAPEVASHKTD